MPPLEKRQLNQMAILWEATGYYNNEGESLVNSPVDINVRWEQTKRELLSNTDAPIQIDAMAFCDREIPSNSLMKLGFVSELTATPSGLFEVLFCESVPDIKGRNTEYTVMLRKTNRSLPT